MCNDIHAYVCPCVSLFLKKKRSQMRLAYYYDRIFFGEIESLRGFESFKEIFG